MPQNCNLATISTKRIFRPYKHYHTPKSRSSYPKFHLKFRATIVTEYSQSIHQFRFHIETHKIQTLPKDPLPSLHFSSYASNKDLFCSFFHYFLLPKKDEICLPSSCCFFLLCDKKNFSFFAVV